MKIKIQPTEILIIQAVDENKIVASIDINHKHPSSTVEELICKALKEDYDLDDIVLTDPRDFDSSNEEEEILTFHFFRDGSDWYEDVRILAITNYN